MTTNDDGDNDGTDSAKTKTDLDVVCFHHVFFQANQPKLLHKIQRTTKQVPPTVTESSPSQMEVESIKIQLEDMKERMDSVTDEFETKLAKMKASMELDYLRRINAVELCYKDLVSTIIAAKEPSPFSLASRLQSRAICDPISPLASSYRQQTRRAASAPDPATCSRSSILVRANNAAKDFLVGQRLNLLSSSLNQHNHSHNHHSQGGGILFGNGNDIPVGLGVSQQQQLLTTKDKQQLLSTTSITKQQQQLPSSSTAYMNGLRLLETFQQQHTSKPQTNNNALDNAAILRKFS